MAHTKKDIVHPCTHNNIQRPTEIGKAALLRCPDCGEAILTLSPKGITTPQEVRSLYKQHSPHLIKED